MNHEETQTDGTELSQDDLNSVSGGTSFRIGKPIVLLPVPDPLDPIVEPIVCPVPSTDATLA
jgi:hypothetical protein